MSISLDNEWEALQHSVASQDNDEPDVWAATLNSVMDAYNLEQARGPAFALCPTDGRPLPSTQPPFDHSDVVVYDRESAECFL